MKNLIIIYNDKKQLNQFLAAAFGRTQKLMTEIFSYKQISVICSPAPITVDQENSVVVFLDINDTEVEIKKANECIVSSENINALKILSNCNIPCLTCGNNITDSISLSSITDEKVVVCQQRNIKTIYGETIPPREFPFLRKNNCPIKILLLASATQAVIGFKQY